MRKFICKTRAIREEDQRKPQTCAVSLYIDKIEEDKWEYVERYRLIHCNGPELRQTASADFPIYITRCIFNSHPSYIILQPLNPNKSSRYFILKEEEVFYE